MCPTILPNPSAPSVKDLGKHADTVCAAIESMNLTDQRSIVIGVMIASLLSAELVAARCGPGDNLMIIETVAKLWPEQFIDCQRQFGSLTQP